MRLAAGGVHPGQLHQVFLTHLHSDHVTDFNDLVTTRWAAWPVLSPLPVTGPIGTAAFAQRTIDMLSDDIGYRISHHDDLNEPPRCDVNEVAIGQAFESEGVRVASAPTDHRPVAPTLGYRVEHEGKSIVLAGDTVPCATLDVLCADADIYVQTVVRPDLIQRVPVGAFQRRDRLPLERRGRRSHRGAMGSEDARAHAHGAAAAARVGGGVDRASGRALRR